MTIFTVECVSCWLQVLASCLAYSRVRQLVLNGNPIGKQGGLFIVALVLMLADARDPIQVHPHSLANSLTHSLTNSLTHSLTHTLAHTLRNPLARSLTGFLMLLS